MEPIEERKARVKKILLVLHRLFPDAKTELNYTTGWELLVAVQLSAQCTDKLVNRVTEKLFSKYPRFEDYLSVSVSEFDQDIWQVNFHSNKAKNILAAAKVIHEKFNDRVPDTMEGLVGLPGVARKTANVLLTNLYGISEGIVVDTHVIRMAQKLGLTDKKDSVKIEKDLMEVVPRDEWGFFGSALVLYGRHICTAREHECREHELTKIYPEAATIWPKK